MLGILRFLVLACLVLANARAFAADDVFAPAADPSVVHATWWYPGYSLYGDDDADLTISLTLHGRFKGSYSPCVLSLAEGVCIDLYGFGGPDKFKANQWVQQNGVIVRNTGARSVAVDISGCRITNAGQTIILDHAGTPRSRTDNRTAYEDTHLKSYLRTGGSFSAPMSAGYFSDDYGQELKVFGPGATMTCDKALVRHLKTRPPATHAHSPP